MKVLELFAGSRSVGNVSNNLGYKVFSIDVKPFKGIDLMKDIEYLSIKDIPFIPDIIWASPPCTSYSIAAISHHRNGIIPKSDFAIKSDKLVKNTLAIINDFLKLNSSLKFYIENPSGMLQKMPFMNGINRVIIDYCRYGDTRMKPTTIFSNNIYSLFNQTGWKPKGRCFNGNRKCQHEAAPRGSKTGTQGLKNNYERSKVPTELILDILRT